MFAPQSIHAVAAVTGWNLAYGHSVHSTPSELNVPGAQGIHPSRDAEYPGRQAHRVCPILVFSSVSGHCKQSSSAPLATVAANVLEGHGMHVSLVVALTVAE